MDRRVGWWGLVLCVMLSSCAMRLERRIGPSLRYVDPTANVLKLHMSNGDVFVLSDWRVDARTAAIVGTGKRLTASRLPVPSQAYWVPIREVVLFETNEEHLTTYSFFTVAWSAFNIAIDVVAILLLVAITNGGFAA